MLRSIYAQCKFCPYMIFIEIREKLFKIKNLLPRELIHFPGSKRIGVSTKGGDLI